MAKKVMFTLSAEVVGEATSGLLLGEFNNWDYKEGIELEKQKDGSMNAVASLESGKRYEYRYLLNDGRWVNDGSAHQYVHISGLQVENCVINVEEVKKGVEKTSVKKTEVPTKEKVAAVKKTAATKEKVIALKAAPVEKVMPDKVIAAKVSSPKETTPKAKAAPKTKTPKA